MMLYIGIGMVVLGVLAIALGFWFRSQAKQVLATPVHKTGELAAGGPFAGVVGAEGTVRAARPLTAPCSGKPCAYYHLRVEKHVKESQGGQAKQSWKAIGELHQGSTFVLDDGSGGVAVGAEDRLEADLRTSFSGPPPGGGGLGVLTGMIDPGPVPSRGEVLGFRVVEKIIGVDAPLFAMGELRDGRLMRPAGGKVVVSDRGRDGLVGAKKRATAIAVAVGMAVAAGGVPIMILRPGEARPCAATLQDGFGTCVVSSEKVTMDRTQPDGTSKQETFKRHIHKWKVTRPGKYQLFAEQVAKKGRAFPAVQVVEAVTRLPMNVGVNWGALGGDGATASSTTTAPLLAGDYEILVFSDAGGPSSFKIRAQPVPEQSASSR